MDIAYKIMFVVGVLYTFVSFLFSGISGALHLGSHFGHMAGHGHMGGTHAQTAHHGGQNSHQVQPGTHAGGVSETVFSWFSILLNPLVAVSFLTVFGGLGMLGTDYFKWDSIIVLVVALASSIVIATILHRFIAVPLYKSENSTDISRDDLAGKTAEVISSIMENGFGEIRYVINSLRYTAPAKHVDGKAVKQGTEVIICNIQNNVFYITEMERL